MIQYGSPGILLMSLKMNGLAPLSPTTSPIAYAVVLAGRVIASFTRNVARSAMLRPRWWRRSAVDLLHDNGGIGPGCRIEELYLSALEIVPGQDIVEFHLVPEREVQHPVDISDVG